MLTFVRPGGALIDGLVSPSDRDLLTSIADALEFEDQELGRGVIARRQRAVTTDPRIPALLWARLSAVLPPLSAFFGERHGVPRLDPPVSEWVAVGCNPRSRFYRYPIGASFSEHEDEPWRPDSQSRTVLTVLVHLPTHGCIGGETVVDGAVVPVVDGRVLVFDHGLLHEGRPVARGTKLTLRSDVVARPASAPGS